MPNLPRLAHWLRTWADRIDDRGAPKHTGFSFTFEAGEGIRWRDDGKGCPIYYYGAEDYKRAHSEADSHDPIKQEVMELLDAVDSGGDLPPGWTLGGTAGRDDRG